MRVRGVNATTRDPIDSPTVLKATWILHAWDFKISFIFFEINRGIIEIHTVQYDSNNFHLISFNFLAEVSNYRSIVLSDFRAVELSIRNLRTLTSTCR